MKMLAGFQASRSLISVASIVQDAALSAEAERIHVAGSAWANQCFD